MSAMRTKSGLYLPDGMELADDTEPRRGFRD
jgi:hypothetical protein